MKTKEVIKYLLPCMLLAACSDADNFYGKLYNQPEVVADLKVAYAVGDTLKLTGRLNPDNNLIVGIGNVKQTTPLSIAKNVLNLDVMKIIITEEMGIGEKCPIMLTSAGITIKVADIEIVGDANIALLEKQLQLVKVADIPSATKMVYCRNRNGNSYLWDIAAKKLLKIATDGSSTEIFNESKLIDNSGTFTIDEWNTGAVSPDERYFYFSAKVREPGQSNTLELYKFCRFDLQNNTLTLLNRTEYSLVRSRRTLAAIQPFEGKVNDVKIYQISAIYPDTEGNVYCNLMNHFLTKLDKDGNYTYLIDFSYDVNFRDGFIPQINNPDVSDYYTTAQVHEFLPGIRVPQFSYIDPEGKIGYRSDNQNSRIYLVQTDLISGFDINKQIANSFDASLLNTPYVTASLNTFNGNIADHIGAPLPVEGNKLIGLYFREQYNTGSSYYDDFYEPYELPALCEIDLINKRAIRYAPKRLVTNGFDIRSSYQFLSLDSKGMLYMTANSGKVIVKTTYVE